MGSAVEAAGIIFSGGPSSIYDEGVPTVDGGLLDLDVPVLGLCYGMHIIADLAGAQVVNSKRHEYGRVDLDVIGGRLFGGFTPSETTPVWMKRC